VLRRLLAGGLDHNLAANVAVGQTAPALAELLCAEWQKTGETSALESSSLC
jgi:hypothetical protein